ncbi:hypothetical protein BDD12DRAFT_839851 [Trichophaea hybrida]|nr:hypothetical protein BDD12DRAFT_839851 [Trichophaea hybrida]
MWMTGAILGKDEDQTQQDNESDDSTLNRKRRKSNTRRISFKSKEIELITRPRQEKPWEKPGWIEPTFAPEVEMQDAPPLVPTPEVEKQENAVPEAEQQENTAPSSPTQRPTELPTDRKFRRLACNRPLERSGLVYDSKAKKVRPCTEQEEIETLYCIGHPEHPVPKPKEEKRWVKIGDMHTKESLKSIPTLEPTRKRWFPWFKPVITEPKESKPKPEIIRTIAERNHDDTLIPGWEADLPKLMYM